MKFVELTTNATDGDGGGSIPGYKPENIGNGRQVVTVAATRVQLAASLVIGEVIIVAEFTNNGTIVVGGDNVVAVLATRQGVPLNPGDAVIISVNDISKIWIDSTASGDGVTFTWVK